MVFDITSKKSFTSVGKWIEDAKNLRDDDVLLIVVGNKSDWNDRREVSSEEAKVFAQQRNLMYFETSARTGSNIKYMFNEMAKKLTGIESINVPEE